mmetsp:Transcript_6253/g.16978  ORF Transcript_6253/g.16978 Transcript_6253/m.16978 type:complete len:217 (-) Transcript_6253:280-930(-)
MTSLSTAAAVSCISSSSLLTMVSTSSRSSTSIMFSSALMSSKDISGFPSSPSAVSDSISALSLSISSLLALSAFCLMSSLTLDSSVSTHFSAIFAISPSSRMSGWCFLPKILLTCFVIQSFSVFNFFSRMVFISSTLAPSTSPSLSSSDLTISLTLLPSILSSSSPSDLVSSTTLMVSTFVCCVICPERGACDDELPPLLLLSARTKKMAMPAAAK